MTFHLSISNPENVIYNEEVYSIIVPGTLGYMEILKNHAALLSTLSQGKVIVTKKNFEKLYYTISGGLIEVSKNQATVLVDGIA